MSPHLNTFFNYNIRPASNRCYNNLGQISTELKVCLGATYLTITLTMFLMGILLGFIGAGGSGFIIALLTVVFGVPIQTALGTSLAAMVFTTMSGAYSHYRQEI